MDHSLARMLSPLPSLQGFVEATAEDPDPAGAPGRLQAVLRVIAAAARASIDGPSRASAGDRAADPEQSPPPS